MSCAAAILALRAEPPSPLNSGINNILNPAPTFQAASLGVKTAVRGAPSLAEGGSLAPAQQKGNFGGDPIIGKANAYADQISHQALAAAIAAKKQDLIRFGDPDMVQRVLGHIPKQYTKGAMAGLDKQPYKYADTVKAAANNAFGTTQELKRWNDRSITGVNEARNQQGLFYSSARARDLALQGEDYTRQKTKAANDLQDAINAIEMALQQSLQQAQGIRIQAGGG